MKKKLLIALVVIVVLAIVWFGTAFLQQPPKNPLVIVNYEDYLPDYSITKEQLIQDVDFYASHVDKMHADPYKIITRQNFFKKAEEINARIRAHSSEKFDVFEAQYHLQELAASIQDGHTRVNRPWKWGDTVDSVFPLTLIPVGKRLFIENNYGENDLPARAEILAINGIPIKQMMDETMKYVDATLPHFKSMRWAFYLRYFIQTYYRMQSPWDVTYVHEGTRATTSIKGMAVESLRKALAPQGDYRESEFTVNGESIPVLELVGFGSSKWKDFQKFHNEFFSRHKDKKYLVIDVRQHPGGNGLWGYWVLAHITDSPFRRYSQFTFKASPTYKKLVRYYFQLGYYRRKIPWFLWGLPLYKFKEQEDAYYWINRGILESEPGAFVDSKTIMYEIKEEFDRFKGKVYLLISHRTFSAGVVFAAAFKSSGMGIVVGRETGGRVDFLSDSRWVEFPNSKLLINMPVAKLVLEGDNPDRGVLPDVHVEFTPEDYIKQRDKDIEKVKELIREELEIK